MKNRKIVIPLFIILIISFVAMLFFYFYKKHNDKIKLQEEQKLNEKLIKDTLNKMGKGSFSDEDLNNAIQTIISAIEVCEDSNTGIINNYYAQSLVDADTLDIKIKKYSNITKEEVVNIAKKIKMDTIYILEGDTNEND